MLELFIFIFVLIIVALILSRQVRAKLLIVVAIFMLFAIIYDKTSQSEKEEANPDSLYTTDEIIRGIEQYHKENFPKPLTKQEAPETNNAKLNIPESKSAAYDEGYHKGYADGEEDAYNHSENRATYNDANEYRGKKARDYEDGYSYGYESGWADNYWANNEEYDN